MYSQTHSLGHKRKVQKRTSFGAYWEANLSTQAKKWCENLKVIPIFSHASCRKVIKNVDWVVLLGKLSTLTIQIHTDLVLLFSLLMFLTCWGPWRQFEGEHSRPVILVSYAVCYLFLHLKSVFEIYWAGQRNIPLYSRWSNDRRCFHSGLSHEHICLGWSAGGC